MATAIIGGLPRVGRSRTYPNQRQKKVCRASGKQDRGTSTHCNIDTRHTQQQDQPCGLLVIIDDAPFYVLCFYVIIKTTGPQQEINRSPRERGRGRKRGKDATAFSIPPDCSLRSDLEIRCAAIRCRPVRKCVPVVTPEGKATGGKGGGDQ